MSYVLHTHTHTHTHTQPFYCSAGICPGLPGWAGTRKVKPGRVKPIWIYWSKRQWVAVASAGLYASLHLISDNHANIPPLSFLQAGCPSCRPTNSVKALNVLYLYHTSVAFYSVGWVTKRESGRHHLFKFSLNWQSGQTTYASGNWSLNQFVMSACLQNMGATLMLLPPVLT